MKIILFFAVAILYLNHGALAQSPEKLKQPKTLIIGDKVPDLEFNNVYNHTSSSLNLAEFKGKAIILDFWATWCGACMARMPHLMEMQQKYEDKLQVLTVNNSPRDTPEKLIAFLKEKKGTKYDIKSSSYPYAKQLDSIFPHKVIPHYVWIGPDRRVKSTTLEITDENLQRLIAGLNLYVTEKQR